MGSVLSRAAFVVFVLVSTTAIGAGGPALTLEVDARDVTQGIQHAHLAIPVHAGSVSLAYPKWIPGEHAATGPLTQLVAAAFQNPDGRMARWVRARVSTAAVSGGLRSSPPDAEPGACSSRGGALPDAGGSE